MTDEHGSDHRVIVIGGGPAGLTAAYELVRHGWHPIVLEQQDRVGGLARTENYKGFHFDLGGHRFFTKSREVQQLWRTILGTDFLRRPRLSRIYYNKKFFHYPLKPLNALWSLGVWESLRCVSSYLYWHFFPYRQEETFEQWVTNRFGKRLFEIFFKTYTEKVWGISCTELKAEWAAQRIKDLSLKTALLSMFVKPKRTIKTLIEEFEYPRLGPGMMWNAVKEQIERLGGQVRLQTKVVEIHRNGTRIAGVTVVCDGRQDTLSCSHLISSMPISEFVKHLSPPPPAEVLRAAERLHHRDFLTVCLIVNQPNLFPDNWIYVHDPAVKVGRIQNFKNWSPEMVPDPTKTSLGLEYFCTVGDPLWNMSDAELIELGKREIDRIGLARYDDIADGCVVRVPYAYPIYDADYRDYLALVRSFVAGLENVQTIGRNGLHRYNNQDHAMLTGMLAVRNLVHGEQNDLWSVNADQEYLEEMETEIAEPQLERVEEMLVRVFPKLDAVAFGLALGTAVSLLFCLATLWLVVKGGEVVGPHMQLLGQYFPKYSVTVPCSLLGLAYGFIGGFVGGSGFAWLRNTAVRLYMALVHRRAERRLLRRLPENIL